MGTSITLRNIPDSIYERIKASAARHHRSLNSEIIACLEQVLAPRPVDTERVLERAQQLRGRYQGPPVKIDDVLAAIDRKRG